MGVFGFFVSGVSTPMRRTRSVRPLIETSTVSPSITLTMRPLAPSGNGGLDDEQLLKIKQVRTAMSPDLLITFIPIATLWELLFV
jgi:hypothetical protein